MRTLCIVDNALQSFVGHHFEYSRCLHDCAVKRGDPVLILGHSNPDPKITESYPFERVFRRSPYDFPTTIPVVRDLVNPTVQNRIFFRDLRGALQGRCKPDWIVFTPAMTHNQIFGWAAWLQIIPASQCPTVVLFVRNSYCLSADPRHYDKRAYFAWPGFRWLERLAASGRRVHLVTDSERLAKEFSRLTHLPMPIFPTPHTDRVRPSNAKQGIPRLTWLGGIRRDKGFFVFAEAIILLEEELRSGSLEFVIQSHLDDPNDAETAAVRERIKSAGLPGVTLIEKPLTTEEYANLLSDSGAIVLPRLVQMYRSQTSGPFVEALAAGKPVVVTDDSWMSDQLKNHGAGVTFKDQDAQGLASAIRSLVNNFSDLSRRAKDAALPWTSIHNPDSLYEMICRVGA